MMQACSVYRGVCAREIGSALLFTAPYRESMKISAPCL